MCGIVGFISPRGKAELEPILAKMTGAIRHRGPDAWGHYWKEFTHHTLALGHTRLSILDLSPTGAQPMNSSNGRYTISFNGEIYNHLDLRNELSQKKFRGTSDTETLLVAMEEWGLKETLSKIAGMFAFALWDHETKKLFLARDRMGEKPLYYGTTKGSFFFSSELKTLKHHPDFSSRLDEKAIQLFLQFSYIPTPLTIYKNFYKLPAAHFLEIDEKGNFNQPKCYWSLSEIADKGMKTPFEKEACVDEIESRLIHVLKEQIVADVPVGSFLSGGIDSSLITSLLAKNHNKRVKSFSIGFSQEGYDESAAAKGVADYLGTDHTELYVQPEDALKLIPKLNEIYDEPFADVSQLPSILLSQLARKHVTVGLTGDGGDEIFAGYNRYLFAPKIWKKTNWMPQSLKSTISNTLSANAFWEKILPFPQPGEKIKKLQKALQAKTHMDLYWTLASQGFTNNKPYFSEEQIPAFPFLPMMQYLDQKMYLPDDILVKVDRASMWASLETRAPFLDHRMVESAWRIPLDMRTGDNKGKLILRQILAKHLPTKLWERPKAGFTPPIDFWLRGSLRDWAEDLLSENALNSTGIPYPEKIRSLWLAHSNESSAEGLRLWPALIAQDWLKRNL